jgi:glc operon protein GlcG
MCRAFGATLPFITVKPAMIETHALSLSTAKAVADAARAEADRNGWTVVIAIVDDGGHLVYLERMDGTQKASSVIAQEKARTAILFKRPSAALEKAVADGRLGMMSLPGAVTVEGGLPIVWKDTFVGAIGVSGMASSQDGVVAKAGLEALPA